MVELMDEARLQALAQRYQYGFWHGDSLFPI